MAHYLSGLCSFLMLTLIIPVTYTQTNPGGDNLAEKNLLLEHCKYGRNS